MVLIPFPLVALTFSCMFTVFVLGFAPFSCDFHRFSVLIIFHSFYTISFGYYNIFRYFHYVSNILLHHYGLFRHQNGRPRENRYPTISQLPSGTSPGKIRRATLDTNRTRDLVPLRQPPPVIAIPFGGPGSNTVKF